MRRFFQCSFVRRALVLAGVTCALGWPAVGWADPPEGEETVQVRIDDVVDQPELSADATEGVPVSSSSAVHAGECAACGSKTTCTCEDYKRLRKAVTKSHNVLFYRNRFDYLCDPCYDEWWPGDYVKRNAIGNWGILDVGGQYRARFHDEVNMRGLGLTGRDDRFLLHRTRLYANLEVGSRARFYVEYLDAVSNYENFTPRPIEESRSNIQNLFGDFVLLDTWRGKLTGRVGRQELLYGQQRLISPLDWANTRRTFEGVSLLWSGQKWDIDGFWTYRVPPTDKNFLNTDRSQEFSGVWGKYKGFKNETVETFFIRYIETEGTPFEYNTIGAAYRGNRGRFLWDFWGAYQWGDYNNQDQEAGAWTVGLGWKFECQPWTPTIWAYYDWAEGDDRGAGYGYHHLFPLAHKYNGWMDLFGRRNLEDLNFMATLTPSEKWKLIAWWHIFWLQNGNDVPYSVVMTPYVATPGGSQYLGQELDLLANWQFNPRMSILFGYSYFWAGSFYSTNPDALYADDANFTYVQFTFNF